MADAARQRAWQIDLFRGLALVMIFINHVPDNPLVPLTSANYGFSDAAEGFVLMAGIAAGLVYLRKYQQEGWGGTLAARPPARLRTLFRPYPHPAFGGRLRRLDGHRRGRRAAARLDRPRAAVCRSGGDAARHRHPYPSAALSRHPAALHPAAAGGAADAAAGGAGAGAAARAVGRAVVHCQLERLERPHLPGRRRLDVQPAGLAVPVRHRHGDRGAPRSRPARGAAFQPAVRRRPGLCGLRRSSHPRFRGAVAYPAPALVPLRAR